MTIISSFRLKIYFKRIVQLSVFILTNILAIFHQLLLMELYDTEYISKWTRLNNKFRAIKKGRYFLFSGSFKRSNIRSQLCRCELKKVKICPAPQKSNWTNVFRSWCQSLHLEIILKQMGLQEFDNVLSIKFYAVVTSRNGNDNELESLKIVHCAVERYLKEKNYSLGIAHSREFSNRTGDTHSFDFEITHMISNQIAPHLVQLPLLISKDLRFFSPRSP